MLFLVEHTHRPEDCPIAGRNRDPNLGGKLSESIKKSGARLIEEYCAAPTHKHWYIFEAENIEQLNLALAPGLSLGETHAWPVMTRAQEMEVFHKAGLV